MSLEIMAEEASDAQQPSATPSSGREPLPSLASSLRNLQSLMEEVDYDEISDVFLSICRQELPKGPLVQCRSKLMNVPGPSQTSQGPPGSTRMYFEVTRTSYASTAVPSSSLSLCSASMEPSVAPEVLQEQGDVKMNMETHKKVTRKNGSCPGNNRFNSKCSGGNEDQRDEDTCPRAAESRPKNQREAEDGTTTSLHDGEAISCAATPSKSEGKEFAGLKGRTRRKLKNPGSPVAFLARRSPRLQKTSHPTQQHELTSSPSTKKNMIIQRQQQQTWGAPSRVPSITSERSTAQLNCSKERQIPTAAATGRAKRRRDGGDDIVEAPVENHSVGGERKEQGSSEVVRVVTRGLSPAKSTSSKRKGNCHVEPLKTSFGKQTRGADSRSSARTCPKKKGRTEINEDRQAEAPRILSQSQNQNVSDVEDEPICHYALPVMKEGSDTGSEFIPTDNDDRALIAISHTSLSAVEHEEACLNDKLKGHDMQTPGKETTVATLRHKVLRPLPEPTPQFDFGLFIVRAAAMSKHVDDIFPLLEDDELMERSVVLEKYLGPPKEGAKRRADYFQLDKLVADIPNEGGVYRPFRDIKEAPWCTGLDTQEGKDLPKKEVLRQRIEAQRRWNPFSIFGSSPPSVELEDVFGFEVYQKTAPSARVHHPLFRRLSQFHSFEDLYSSLSKEEWDRVSSAFRHHWNKQCRLDLDWTNDPLTVDEIMWMLRANEQVEDRSSHVYEAEICFCVTPNPNIGFGWNDPRCHKYKAPRPSMGCHILCQPPLAEDFLETKEDEDASQEPGTLRPSLPDPTDMMAPLNPSEELLSKMDFEQEARQKQDSVEAAS